MLVEGAEKTSEDTATDEDPAALRDGEKTELERLRGEGTLNWLLAPPLVSEGRINQLSLVNVAGWIEGGECESERFQVIIFTVSFAVLKLPLLAAVSGAF